jgi:hypothetical protein
MKILSVVEATNVNAVAKLVLDFYRTASELGTLSVEGSIVTFDRTTTASEPNDFIRAARRRHFIDDSERRRFDLSVIQGLKTVARRSGGHHRPIR